MDDEFITLPRSILKKKFYRDTSRHNRPMEVLWKFHQNVWHHRVHELYECHYYGRKLQSALELHFCTQGFMQFLVENYNNSREFTFNISPYHSHHRKTYPHYLQIFFVCCVAKMAPKFNNRCVYGVESNTSKDEKYF